jgi:hypothetical protein
MNQEMLIDSSMNNIEKNELNNNSNNDNDGAAEDGLDPQPFIIDTAISNDEDNDIIDATIDPSQEEEGGIPVHHLSSSDLGSSLVYISASSHDRFTINYPKQYRHHYKQLAQLAWNHLITNYPEFPPDSASTEILSTSSSNSIYSAALNRFVFKPLNPLFDDDYLEEQFANEAANKDVPSYNNNIIKPTAAAVERQILSPMNSPIKKQSDHLLNRSSQSIEGFVSSNKRSASIVPLPPPKPSRPLHSGPLLCVLVSLNYCREFGLKSIRLAKINRQEHRLYLHNNPFHLLRPNYSPPAIAEAIIDPELLAEERAITRETDANPATMICSRDSLLTRLQLQDIFNHDLIKYFTTNQLAKLQQYLPAVDQISPEEENKEDRALKQQKFLETLENPQFIRTLHEYQQLLAGGSLDPELKELRNLIWGRKRREMKDSWKKIHYERYWGEKLAEVTINAKRTDSRNNFIASNNNYNSSNHSLQPVTTVGKGRSYNQISNNSPASSALDDSDSDYNQAHRKKKKLYSPHKKVATSFSSAAPRKRLAEFVNERLIVTWGKHCGEIGMCYSYRPNGRLILTLESSGEEIYKRPQEVEEFIEGKRYCFDERSWEKRCADEQRGIYYTAPQNPVEIKQFNEAHANSTETKEAQSEDESNNSHQISHQNSASSHLPDSHISSSSGEEEVEITNSATCFLSEEDLVALQHRLLFASSPAEIRSIQLQIKENAVKLEELSKLHSEMPNIEMKTALV